MKQRPITLKTCVACGNPFESRYAEHCPTCLHALRSNIAQRRLGKSSPGSWRYGQRMVRVTATCPACREAHIIHLRRQPAHKIWEYCPEHKKRRYWTEEAIYTGGWRGRLPTMDQQEARG